MNLALRIAAGLLVVVALAGGLTKTFVPKDKLAQHAADQAAPRPLAYRSHLLLCLGSSSTRASRRRRPSGHPLLFERAGHILVGIIPGISETPPDAALET